MTKLIDVIEPIPVKELGLDDDMDDDTTMTTI
jgi:hypothetical protein